MKWSWVGSLGLGLVSWLATWPAGAQTIQAVPEVAIDGSAPPGVLPREVQIVLHVVVSATGEAESAVATERVPEDADPAFEQAAVARVRATPFRATVRDGQPVRSRIEYVMVFQPGERLPAPPAPRPAAAREPIRKPAAEAVVQVYGVGPVAPRGLGDFRIRRELLMASPRQHTSEMLSAAPGFFVDHEDGEGLGNDVYLRGFDVEHGSGIEMRLGTVPLNNPTHIQGQGYTDVNFIIPEVVSQVRVLEGPYDPRQGDAAIVGSAYFDLGVAERGYQLKTSYGSFNQRRVLGIVAPRGANNQTFAAFSVRESDGFGQNRASKSGSLNAQYVVDLGPQDQLRLFATGYGARSALAGVVRQDDVEAGRVGFYDSYPYFAQGQSIQSGRVIAGAEFRHDEGHGGRFVFAPWFMWTDFRARQNFTSALQSSQIDPSLSGLGDLFETTNLENALGATSYFRAAPVRPSSWSELAVEPGVSFRIGDTKQTKSLLVPADQSWAWDRRRNARLQTLDAGAYIDLDLRLWKKLRFTGGPRADLLLTSIDDRLANVVPAGSGPVGARAGERRGVAGISIGPRVSVEYAPVPAIAVVTSYGEGFRSLDAASLKDGMSRPYSKVRSAEAGVRVQDAKQRFSSTVSAFYTWVGNELVFSPEEGGLETQNRSVRRGLVTSFLVRPTGWLLVSSALSVTDAQFDTRVPGISHHVPNVPPVLFRSDVSARGPLLEFRGKPLVGRLGAAYTFMSRRYVSDAIRSPTTNALNVGGQLRYDWLELGLEGYNVFGNEYADNAERYISNWSLSPGQQPASFGTHFLAAPPRTLLASATLYF